MLDSGNFKFMSIPVFNVLSQSVYGIYTSDILCIYGILWLPTMEVNNINQKEISISTWSFKVHIFIASSIAIFSYVSANLLVRYTDAALPFLDSLTTFGALFATYMVAKKILENWIYWFLIDATSVYLFIGRELYLTSVLFCIYLVIIIFGYRSWLKAYKTNI
tara:strand:- start:124 stop:612 length:489 start_codon:yes stop_codon:yes gene_type:complete